MVDFVGQWLGKRFQLQAGGTHIALAIFKVTVAAYLGISAAICIRDATSIPAFVVILGWFVLVTEVVIDAPPARRILPPRQAEILSYAMLMLGTAYRVAGHASFPMLLAVIGYWAAVLLARRRVN